MKTLTNKQQSLLERQAALMKEIANNHGDILNWYCKRDYPETLVVETVCFDQMDVIEAEKRGFFCCMYADNCINDTRLIRIEVHIISLK